ncbi:hypothetical protein [Rhizobium gallicum]|nr:hypothetical protein [Rhizobium gallicum]
MALPDRAANILPLLLSAIGPTTGNVLFVGYSLGGLVVQSVLRRAETLAPQDAQMAAFLRRVRGFVLLGTPNAGSAHASAAGWLSWLFRPRETIDDLRHDNPYLRDLNTWFRGFVPTNNVKGLIIREHKPVPKLGVIVAPHSADAGLSLSIPVIPVDEDHVSLSHPVSRQSEVYRHLLDFLRAPFDAPHPDTLLVDGLNDLKDSVQDVRSGVETAVGETLEGQRKVERALQRLTAENPVVTRDAERRLTRIRQIRFTVGFEAKIECDSLMKAVEDGELSSAGKQVRQSIFAWCSRILAVPDYLAAAAAFQKAKELGESEEVTIAEAFLQEYSPNADRAKALAILGKLRTPGAYSASLMISARDNPPAVALQWLDDAGLRVDQLDADGKFRVIGLQLDSHAWSSALETVKALTDSDLEAAPCLLLVSATVYLAHAIHEDMRPAVLAPLFEQLENLPLGEDAASMAYRAKALSHFEKAAAAFEELGANRAAAMAADQALWLSLRDPTSRGDALRTLEVSMRDPNIRLRRLPMALAFGLQLDMQAVEREVDAETALSGGKSHQAAIARFALAITRKPSEVPDYIHRHRDQLLEYYIADYIDAIAVEALSTAGRVEDARSKLSELVARGAEGHIVSTLTRIVDGAVGSDPVAVHEAEYAAQPNVPKLIALVDSLRSARDVEKLADYAGKLFESVKDVANAEVYTSALYEIGADEKIIELANQFPEIVEASNVLGTNLSWAYYRLGNLKDAKSLLDRLRGKRDSQNDRFLYMNIAIASGDWSSLNAFVESEWENRDGREAVELLRAGTLAQRVGASSRSQELIRAAAAKAGNDPNILVNCYSAATSAGWENEEAIHGWLATAIETSGDDGPVKSMDLQEMLDLQPGWNERMDRVWGMLLRGEAPMFLAAEVSNRTLLDLYLRPALRNLSEVDPRKRGVIFAFAGNRPIQQIAGRRIAVDVTALLTLTLVGQLRKVLDWCESVAISHTTLGWLFQERDRLAFHQPSQVRKAVEVKRLIDQGQLHKFEGAAPPPEIEQEVGDDIARYLVTARTVDTADPSQRIVIRPFPLPKAGSLLKETADVSGFENYLAGCSDVVQALKARGHLTGPEESNALSYLRLHEKPWPHAPKVQAGATLYLDDLAVDYFQHVGLLGRLSQAGFKVFVSGSEVERANELVGFDVAGDEARRIVEELQAALRDGIGSGRVELDRLSRTEEEAAEVHPSRLMITRKSKGDVSVVDDRGVNRHSAMGETPIATSVDLLSTMANGGAISPDDLTQCVTKLRQAGLILVPCQPGEILKLLNAAPIVGGAVQETAELRAIRESLTRVRMTDALQLPAEAAWIDDFTRELLNALRGQWSDEISDSDARARSNWVIDLLDPRGWSHRSASTGAGGAERYSAMVTMLLMHTSATPAAKDRYWEWLEEAMIEEFKHEQPALYMQLVASVCTLINNAVDTPAVRGADD